MYTNSEASVADLSFSIPCLFLWEPEESDRDKYLQKQTYSYPIV